MLLSVAACQKIDIDNSTSDKTSNSKSSTSTSKKDKNTSGKDNEAAEDDDEENDGEINVGGITEVDNNQTVAPIFPDVPGHVIAFDKGNNIYMLMSLDEWPNIHPANNTEYADEAKNKAAGYKEGDLTGWRIPNKQEASLLFELYYSDSSKGDYSDNLKALNEMMKIHGGEYVHAWENKTGCPTFHYLCDEANSIFSLKEGTRTVSATKTRTYNLRLVKDTVITKK